MALRNRSYGDATCRFREQLSNVCHKTPRRPVQASERISRNENESDTEYLWACKIFAEGRTRMSQPLSTNAACTTKAHRYAPCVRDTLFDRTFPAGVGVREINNA